MQSALSIVRPREMATDMDQAYHEWSHGKMSEDSQTQEMPFCQVLDHSSISFGRFAVESLSWEKWSVFSHNRCQEELEKFKAPGFVAQKKAYFEEYYKKIRELKALQKEQEIAAALCSGSNSGVSSKGGDEHSTLEAENTGGVTSDTPLSGETIANVIIKKEKGFSNGSHLQYLVPESMLPNVDSSRRDSDNLKVVIGQQKNGFSYLDCECSARKGKHPLTASKCLETNSATQATPSEQAESVARCDSMILEENNLLSNQVDMDAQTCKDCTSICKVKDVVATSAKKNFKLDQRPKGDCVKSSKAKYPLDKPTDRAGGSGNSKKQTSSKNEANKSSTSISSNRQLMEGRSKIMAPRSFLLSKEKGASGSKNTRDDVPDHSVSKVSDRLAKLPVHRKKMSSNQNAPMKTAISSNRPQKEVCSTITIPYPFTFSTEKRAAAPTGTRESAQGHCVSKAANRLEQLPTHKKSMSQMTSVDIAVKRGMTGTSLVPRRSDNPRVKGSSNQQSRCEIKQRSSLKNNYLGKKQNEVKEKPESKRCKQSLKAVGSQLPTSSNIGTLKSVHKKIMSLQMEDGKISRQGMSCRQ